MVTKRISTISRRKLLAATLGAVGAGAVMPALIPHAVAQVRPSGADQKPERLVRTTNLFRCPEGYPNGMAKGEDGIWVGEQKLSAELADRYGIAEPDDLVERAWLLDWKTGKVKKTVETESRNTSGMAYGAGRIWMVANAPPYGVFETSLDSKTISHRQVPLGGGGNHGAKYRDGKLWIVSTRLNGMLCIDEKTWQPEFMIPYDASLRHHDMAFDDDGNIWLITGNRSSSKYEEGQFGLAKYDARSGEIIETARFEEGSADPHGLEYHNGALYSCDAGIHPGWPVGDSPHSGYFFRIDFV